MQKDGDRYTRPEIAIKTVTVRFILKETDVQARCAKGSLDTALF